ncbi:MAG: hypothetical protein RDV48_22660 [Candidatus Eremiobacteraeota bacterium]|nr:hypothetical protein [Candidatus Eremiobacteraeota bacterium]
MKAVFFVIILCGLTLAAFAQESPVAVEQKYIRYGLLPLTEGPGEDEQDYRVWQNACDALLKMDGALASDARWAQEGGRERLIQDMLKQYQVNELVKLFNLGHYGNRYYSAFSGPRSDGATTWKAKAWFLNNPRDRKEVGPRYKYRGTILFSISGSTVKGELRDGDSTVGELTGTLSDKTIDYTLTFRSGENIKKGSLTVVSPTYLSGTWTDERALPRDAHGEWEVIKIFEE